MAKRRKNGEGSWGTKVIKGTTYQYYRNENKKYTYGKTTSEVKKKLEQKEKLDKSERENDVESNLFTFGNYALKWLYIKKSEIEIGTYDDYETIINARIIDYTDYDLSGKQIKSLTEEMFRNYLDSLSKKYSIGTIKKTWGIIKQIVKYGEIKGDIQKGLIELIKTPIESNVAVKTKEVQSITESDMDILYKESFRKYPNADRNMYGNAAKVIILIMYSGLRVSEACALKWKDIDLKNETITVANSIRRIKQRDKDHNVILDENGKQKYKVIVKNPKTENGYREIPIPERGIEILKYFDSINPNHKPEDFVCITKNKTHYEKRKIERCLKDMLDRSNCGNKLYTPHSLRHGYGSILISKGADIKLVSELLGHSDVTFTYNVYISIFKEDKKKATSLFNK